MNDVGEDGVVGCDTHIDAHLDAAIGVGVNDVAENGVATGVADLHAVVDVVRNQIGRFGNRAADQVATGAVAYLDSVAVAAPRDHGAVPVGADVVALNYVPH